MNLALKTLIFKSLANLARNLLVACLLCNNGYNAPKIPQKYTFNICHIPCWSLLDQMKTTEHLHVHMSSGGQGGKVQTHSEYKWLLARQIRYSYLRHSGWGRPVGPPASGRHLHLPADAGRDDSFRYALTDTVCCLLYMFVSFLCVYVNVY